MNPTALIRNGIRSLAFVLILIPLSTGGPAAQKVPIDFNDFHTTTATFRYLRDIAAAYPGITELQEIGKSTLGRPIYVLVVPNLKTGTTLDAHVTLQHPREEGVKNVTPMKPYMGKPGHYVGGSTHGNEYTGTEVSLWLIDKLVSGYGSDKEITDLVDTKTLYICPIINPDGHFNGLEKGISQRANVMMKDEDGDGKINEDGPDDLDGDGVAAQFRYRDPKGMYVLDDAEPRLMVRLGPNEQTTKERYSVVIEDKDNDGDSMINEDDVGGPDPNRNYPFGWSLESGYPYPLSEQENRNVFEFMMAHTNLFASFHYHNTGRLIMFQAPPAAPAAQTPEARQRATEALNQRLAELRKINKYAYIADRQVAPEYQQDMDSQNEMVSMGARILKDYTPTVSPISGMTSASTYYMFGAYSYLIELWGSPAFEADINSDGRVSDDEYMKWIDTELMGEGWVAPHKFRHPDLGETWIGGTAKKHIDRTPPARYMETEALRQANFALYCASQFPHVDIAEVRVVPVTDELYWVEVIVQNNRAFPTSSDRSVFMKRAAMDKITVTGSGNVIILDIPKAGTVLDPLNRAAQSEVISKQGSEFRLKARDSKRFCVLVKMTGAEGWVEFAVKSQAGGAAVRKVALKLTGPGQRP